MPTQPRALTPPLAGLDLRALLLGLAFAAMWSSAFSSARIIVAAAPPITSLALRFWISGAIAVGLALLMGQSLRLTAAQWRATAVFGLCQNALYLGAYFVAMRTVEASAAAIAASTMPLLVAGLGWAFLGQRVGAVGAAGLLAGLAGVALIMGARITGGADPFGLALCGLGALALAVATLSVRGAIGAGGLLMAVGLQMLVGAAALSLLVPFEAWELRWSPALGLAFAYTVVVPGLLATLTWFALVRRVGPVRAATFHFLNPVFGVAIAAVLLGERVGPRDALGVAVIALGILLVQASRRG